LVLGWARYQLCARWSPNRCLVKHGGAVSSSSQSSDKYAHHGEYQYAVSAGNALSLCQRKQLHHLHTTWRAPDYAPGFNLGIGIGPVGIGIGPAWGC
jgi:hypothetical protein